MKAVQGARQACPPRAAWLLALLLAACAGNGARPPGAGDCEESPEALVQQPQATIEAAGRTLAVEVADDGETRRRGLQHRRCGITGLLLVAGSANSSLPIWMCEVVLPLDLAFLRGGTVVHVEAAAPPCAWPCGDCPTYGSDVIVDSVLETPAGSFPLQVGDTINVL